MSRSVFTSTKNMSRCMEGCLPMTAYWEEILLWGEKYFHKKYNDLLIYNLYSRYIVSILLFFIFLPQNIK